MGRGLSALQQTILRLAYNNHVDEQRSMPVHQILAFYPITGPNDEEMTRETRDKAITFACDTLRSQLPGHKVWVHIQAQDEEARSLIDETEDQAEAEHICNKAQERGIKAKVRTDFNEWADLYTHEVLIAAFGFGEYRKLMMNGQPCALRYNYTYTSKYEYYRGVRVPNGQFFDRQRIGLERYNAAVASVSRSFIRLEQRKLVWRIYGGRDWMGIDLTPAGLAVAQELSVNTVMNPNSINQ